MQQHYNPDTTDNKKEMLYEVTEHDEVVGAVSREVCHNGTRKPWHRSVHVYLFTNEGELYFHKRSLKKDTAPGLWTVSAGGHVVYGDSYEYTAEKELEEELGIFNTELTQIDKLAIDYGAEKEVIAIFAGVTDRAPRINKEEVEEITAFNYSSIKGDFLNGEFELSGGSKDSFAHVISTGTLDTYFSSKDLVSSL